MKNTRWSDSPTPTHLHPRRKQMTRAMNSHITPGRVRHIERLSLKYRGEQKDM